jgi:16S rRNA (guanine966-N2)-methyltransferase
MRGNGVRVTGGVAGGTNLRSPKSPGVRPTTDRVRSALFNILAGYGLEETRVVDLYAGTGTLGIEALSRGAAHADFIELDRRQVDVIRENLRLTKLDDRATVHRGDVRQAIETLTAAGRYDYVLMDPPYTEPFPVDVVERIGAIGMLVGDGIAIVGHASRVRAPERCGVLERWQDRRYGDATLAFYRVSPDDQNTGEASLGAAPAAPPAAFNEKTL